MKNELRISETLRPNEIFADLCGIYGTETVNGQI